jgi:putative oxidoreductase
MMPQSVALAGRILLSLVFIMSGMGKIAGPAEAIQSIASHGMPMPQAAYVVSVIIELGGSVALLVGWQARLAASVLALFCVITAVVFHSNFADHNMQIQFMKNLAIAGGMLQVAAFGGGAFSLDAMLTERKVGGVSGSLA